MSDDSGLKRVSNDMFVSNQIDVQECRRQAVSVAKSMTFVVEHDSEVFLCGKHRAVFDESVIDVVVSFVVR